MDADSDTDTLVPTGEPLLGRHVRLDLLGEADLPELHPLLADPVLYASGYVMHRRPVSVADARDLARTRFLAGQGQADGRGGGRTAYAIRLVADGPLGRAGSLVGTSSLLEAHVGNQSIHLAPPCTDRGGGARRSTPKPSCCCSATASGAAATAASRSKPTS